jgi:hypothetical protein
MKIDEVVKKKKVGKRVEEEMNRNKRWLER